jgi:hypothetical protein
LKNNPSQLQNFTCVCVIQEVPTSNINK